MKITPTKSTKIMRSTQWEFDMACFYCFGCDNYVDDDYHPMEADGLCPTCHIEKEEQAGESLDQDSTGASGPTV